MTEQVRKFLNSLEAEERLKLEIANRCGPVLKGVKAANLLAVCAGGWQQVCRILEETPVICRLLYADGQRELLYLYRYELLEHHLRKEPVRRFLQKLGYETLQVEAVLTRLSRRYQQYAGAGQAFPHEMGILLQYPPEDVEGFVTWKGQNWLACGYWKVYGNLQEAEKTFAAYDLARLEAVTELLSGIPFPQVTIR